jgi:hypothetical protein
LRSARPGRSLCFPPGSASTGTPSQTGR